LSPSNPYFNISSSNETKGIPSKSLSSPKNPLKNLKGFYFSPTINQKSKQKAALNVSFLLDDSTKERLRNSSKSPHQ